MDPNEFFPVPYNSFSVSPPFLSQDDGGSLVGTDLPSQGRRAPVVRTLVQMLQDFASGRLGGSGLGDLTLDMHGAAGPGKDGQEHGGRQVVIDFIAGSLGATTSVYVGQPLDTLKVKMQTFPKLYPSLGICFRFELQFLKQLAVFFAFPFGFPPPFQRNPEEGRRRAWAVRRDGPFPGGQRRREQRPLCGLRDLPEPGGPGLRRARGVPARRHPERARRILRGLLLLSGAVPYGTSQMQTTGS